MKTIKKTFFLALLLPLFVACDFDDDGYSLDNYWIDIATVENPDSSSFFYFRLDNNDIMWTAATNFRHFRPVDGQRIIANYTILSNGAASSSYNHDVKLNDVYKVLTKGIFPITTATADSIGNDSIHVKNMWIGSDFLNVQFVYTGYDKTHFINLVSDASKVYTDGKMHLEFRHNGNGDTPMYYRSGIVSFNLKSLQTGAGSDSINLVIYVNEPNMVADKKFELTYKFGNSAMSSQRNLVTFPEMDASKVN